MAAKKGKNNPSPPPWNDSFVHSIIVEGRYDLLVNFAEKLGVYLAESEFTTSQIRNIFGEIRRLHDRDRYSRNRHRLHMLRPKLAYMAARQGKDKTKRAAKELQKVLTRCIEEVFKGAPDLDTEYDRFSRLADFLEAVLAYHRAAGGRT